MVFTVFKYKKINRIKIATLPVSGTISSRYGASSKIRVSTHTGLDIAASVGTPIKVVANGTVTFAEESNGIILSELFEAYQSFYNNQSPKKSSKSKFSQFIKYLSLR